MKRKRAAVAMLATFLAVQAGTARAESSEAGKAGSDFGTGVVAVLGNVVYIPVKLTYAVLGGVTGSLAYVLTGGNRDVADGVWVPSMGGDYVLTTDMMTGREKVHFNGVRDRRGSDGASAESGEGGSGGPLF